MSASDFPVVFDGHNDTILALLRPRDGAERTFFEHSTHGHIDLPRARMGGLSGGFFAVWLPSPVDLPALTEEMSKPEYDLPMPEPLGYDHATRHAMAQVGQLHRLQAAGAGRLPSAVAELSSTFAADELR